MEREFRRLEGQITRDEIQLEREAEMAKSHRLIPGQRRHPLRSWEQDSTAANRSNGYETATKSDLIANDRSFADHLQERGLIRHQREYEGLTVGGCIRSLVTGPRTTEEKRALAEGSDSTGGISVPDITLSRFIDRLRARTVCFRAGAQTLPLTSDKIDDC